jgi:hypothetical protein
VIEGNEEAVNYVRHALEKAGLSTDVVLAQAFLENLPQVEAIERLITIADQRRASLLRDLERRRESRTRRVRMVSEDIIDVDVEPTGIGLR